MRVTFPHTRVFRTGTGSAAEGRVLPRLCRAAVVLVAALGAFGCRGQISDKPPLHPVLDMDFQDKFKAQMESDFAGWEDGRAMRTPPPGTVRRLPELHVAGTVFGPLEQLDLSVYERAEGEFIDNPLPRAPEVVERGRERFDIYCAVCHDRAGSGKGLVLQRAQIASPGSFNFQPPHLGKEERLVQAKDGYLFKVISEGLNTMPSYAGQIPVADRWAIVHWVRVLQSRFQ